MKNVLSLKILFYSGFNFFIFNLSWVFFLRLLMNFLVKYIFEASYSNFFVAYWFIIVFLVSLFCILLSKRFFLRNKFSWVEETRVLLYSTDYKREEVLFLSPNESRKLFYYYYCDMLLRGLWVEFNSISNLSDMTDSSNNRSSIS